MDNLEYFYFLLEERCRATMDELRRFQQDLSEQLPRKTGNRFQKRLYEVFCEQLDGVNYYRRLVHAKFSREIADREFLSQKEFVMFCHYYLEGAIANRLDELLVQAKRAMLSVIREYQQIL